MLKPRNTLACPTVETGFYAVETVETQFHRFRRYSKLASKHPEPCGSSRLTYDHVFIKSLCEGAVRDADAYSLAVCRGKGVAAWAARNISTGEIIVEESPVLTRSFCQKLTPEVLLTLPTKTRDAIMDLSDCWHPDDKTLDTIMDTNALSLGDGSATSVLCLTISRFNHSCAPNVAHKYRASDGFMHLVASRNIASGEELCLPYIEIFAPRKTRQKALKVGYNFTCTCDTCSLSTKDSEASDIRRARAKELNTLITASIDDPTTAVPVVKEYLRLLKEEKLAGF